MKEKRPMNKLARMRIVKGLTQRELCKKCGLNEEAVSMYERGLRNPNLNTLSLLAKALGCTPGDLI